MRVTNQLLDGDIVSLYGIGFNYSKTDYRDDSYLIFDAFHNFRIPINTFLNNLNEEILTKDEFISKFTEVFHDSVEFGLEWINSDINE